ncbi:hypothetical protein [Streptomyces sp. NPDC060027]|uniref:hypothetical protein n=1 Tax=Streptomyces sp. NPDC060027 TaxID=3347040 RepID=UPI00368EE329
MPANARPALLRLRVSGAVLRVELWDSNPVMPSAKAPAPRSIGHHGLEIVQALARTATTEQTAAEVGDELGE